MNAKALFDTIKRIAGRGLSQAEVDQVNAALDSAAKPDAPSAPELPITPSEISEAGLALIERFEGCRLSAYRDPGTGNLPITIGWGSTKGRDGKDILLGTTITQAEADDLLERDLVKYAAEVKQALGPALARTSQSQFDAMVSFHYNTGAIGRATLTAKHRAGDYDGAAAEFARWNRAGGRVLAGLVKRRAAEAKLYLEGSA